MGKYVIKRLLQLIPVVLGITFLSFAMMRLAGGDVSDLHVLRKCRVRRLRRSSMRPEAEYGLDQPFLVQYGKMAERILRKSGRAMSRIRMLAASFCSEASADPSSSGSLLFTIQCTSFRILAVKRTAGWRLHDQFFSFINSMQDFLQRWC